MSRYPLKWPSDMPVARETANMNYSVVHCARTQLYEILILHVFSCSSFLWNPFIVSESTSACTSLTNNTEFSIPVREVPLQGAFGQSRKTSLGLPPLRAVLCTLLNRYACTNGDNRRSNVLKAIFWTEEQGYVQRFYLLHRLNSVSASFWTLNSSSALVPAVPIWTESLWNTR